PPLTTDECCLLSDNSGCFKCQWFFQNHTTHNCLNDFPDANTYKMLTADDVESAQGKKCPHPVAVVTEEEPAVKCACSSDDERVAVVMPSVALGDGSDSGEEYVALFSVPHFHWSCLVNGPNVPSAISMKALIDNGSHLVLIDAALVKQLGLHHHSLPKPYTVSVALSLGDHKCLSLQQYVVLSCYSSDGLFCSHSVHAVIAPHLCTPLLLGMPFVAHNCIVIDHELCTCIVKDTRYDLMHPPVSVSLDLNKSPASTYHEVYKLQQAVMMELNEVLPRYHVAAEASYDNMKAEFADCFPTDILPAKSLPDNVLFWVQPRDATKVILLCSYDCLKKYQEAWR
ncbi:hypothetical protein F5141DRAFT_988573, partial [Pisolithus sp. B1]